MEYTRVEQIAIEKFKRSSNKLVASSYGVIYAELIIANNVRVLHNLN